MVLFSVVTPCYLARFVLEPRYVNTARPQEQAGRQFRLDMGLFLLAGSGVALVNYFYFDFPVLSSGSKLVLSLTTVGFFAAIDLSLARERALLRNVRELGLSLHPPKEYTPLTRKFSLVATSILLLVGASMLLLFWRDLLWLVGGEREVQNIARMRQEVLVEVGFVMSVLMVLTIRAIISYSANLQLLFRNETLVLEQVSNGDLNGAVPVLTNDEFGYIAGHTNTMIDGLRDRMRMREGLIVAREVQQNLLPGKAPHISGVHIFGRSYYSDETGGDLYDFYEHAGPDGEHVGIVVGDVSGHGVGPALLMATARAMFRLRMEQQIPLAQCMTDVNRLLARDLFGSGRFMTALAMLVHKATGAVEICSAGHDPAIFYDPVANVFREVGGKGLALGVDPDWRYESVRQPALAPGELLVVGTDGIWETSSPGEEMFGKERFREVVREYGREPKSGGAATCEDWEALWTRLLDVLEKHRGGAALDDDITMVILEGRHRS